MKMPISSRIALPIKISWLALSEGASTAQNVAVAMRGVYENIGIDYEVHVSKVNVDGVREL